MNRIPWYPLRFEPIYQYRPWGGRRLANVLSTPLPGDDERIGEAWLISDRDECLSRVADGPLAGQTIAELIRDSPQELLGASAAHWRRFPLLLKFLDVCDRLSVQVHPTDDQTAFLPQAESGKTEAWVVLHSGAAARVYAGLDPQITAEDLRQALATRTVADYLASFTPQIGDAVLLPAGTVHSLQDVVVFEVQQNSDVTFRLDDWDRIDAKTGRRRHLQVEQALACLTFPQGMITPVLPVVEAVWPVLRERLFLCEHFGVWRLHGGSSFPVGKLATARLLVCIEGGGTLVHDEAEFAFRKGEVLLLPAAIGLCRCQTPTTVTLLEISLPESPPP
ncbi:MAG TPA: type I phosphomannose isomerase catalytic subunit [Steroidobacteraceae bacterium]